MHVPNTGNSYTRSSLCAFLRENQIWVYCRKVVTISSRRIFYEQVFGLLKSVASFSRCCKPGITNMGATNSLLYQNQTSNKFCVRKQLTWHLAKKSHSLVNFTHTTIRLCGISEVFYSRLKIPKDTVKLLMVSLRLLS